MSGDIARRIRIRYRCHFPPTIPPEPNGTARRPIAGQRLNQGLDPRAAGARSFGPALPSAFCCWPPSVVAARPRYWASRASILPSIQGDAQAWQPSPFVPTPTPLVSDESAAEELIATTFAIGDPVRNVTNSRVNVRRSPGYLSKSGDDVLGQLQPGDALEIVGEPAAADNLIWWRIRYRSSEGQVIEGWVAEATASGVQILSR